MHDDADPICNNADMHWDDLRYLLAVERTGSLARAAKALRVDQTTVGRRLDALQAGTGARLVERTSTGCRLTRAGVRACAAARAMDAAAHALESEIGRDAALEGTVRITTAAGLVPLLVRALSDLRATHPGLVFELLTATQKLNLVRGEADVAIRMTRESQASLITRKLGEIHWGLYAAESYLRRRPLQRTFRGHDVIAYVDPVARSVGGEWLRKHAREANIALRTADVVSAVTAAAEGLGVVAVPVFMAEREPGLLPARSGSIGTTDFFVVTTRHLARVPRIRTTVEHLTHALRAVVPS